MEDLKEIDGEIQRKINEAYIKAVNLFIDLTTGEITAQESKEKQKELTGLLNDINLEIKNLKRAIKTEHQSISKPNATS